MTTIFFATDIHGSSICWQKFINAGKFYKADVIVLGGDMTGKAIVPIVDLGNQTYRAVLLQQESILHGEEEVEAMIKKIRSRGYYAYRTNPDEIQELSAQPEKVNDIFTHEALRTIEEWVVYADKKLTDSGITCFVAPGNDDMFEVDELIRASKTIHLAEGEVVHLDNEHEMISSGWTNPTPWHTFREEKEDQLEMRFQAMISQIKNIRTSIFNMHAPPYASTLDDAPEMTKDLRPKYAGNSLIPVGSRAVRAVIEKNQPLLTLHGHIHESRGTSRIGRTLCVNPGSVYEQGYLNGAVISLGRDKIKSHVLTNG